MYTFEIFSAQLGRSAGSDPMGCNEIAIDHSGSGDAERTLL